MAEVEMANLSGPSAEEFAKLSESVTVLSGNLDQFFLVIMGCCIFCKYPTLSLAIIFLV